MPCLVLAGCYLDGPCGYLDMVQPAQCALSVNEVGGRQLVQGFQGHSRAVPSTPNYSGTSWCFCLSAQLPLVHKNGQGLFSYNKNSSSLVRFVSPRMTPPVLRTFSLQAGEILTKRTLPLLWASPHPSHLESSLLSLCTGSQASLPGKLSFLSS